MTLRFDVQDCKSYTSSILQFSPSRLSLMAYCLSTSRSEKSGIPDASRKMMRFSTYMTVTFATESHWNSSGKKQCFLYENEKNLTGSNILKTSYMVYMVRMGHIIVHVVILDF